MTDIGMRHWWVRVELGSESTLCQVLAATEPRSLVMSLAFGRSSQTSAEEHKTRLGSGRGEGGRGGPETSLPDPLTLKDLFVGCLGARHQTRDLTSAGRALPLSHASAFLIFLLAC